MTKKNLDSAEYISEIIQEIQSSSNKNKESYFKNLYPEFEKKYPHLFKMSCETIIDKTILDFMLLKLDKIRNNNMTQNDASIDVGQVLFDKYIDPKINNSK